MAKFIIADEVNDSTTADVLSSGALEVNSVYNYITIPSGTASGVLVAAPCYLHTIVVANTAAAGAVFHLFDTLTACATAGSTQSSSSAVARIDLGARNTYLFDTYIGTALTYRLSGIVCDGITVTYQLA